jgi:hypothetical protein
MQNVCVILCKGLDNKVRVVNALPNVGAAQLWLESYVETTGNGRMKLCPYTATDNSWVYWVRENGEYRGEYSLCTVPFVRG